MSRSAGSLTALSDDQNRPSCACKQVPFIKCRGRIRTAKKGLRIDSEGCGYPAARKRHSFREGRMSKYPYPREP